MSSLNPNDKELAKHILGAELKSLSDAFWKNESSGETRVQFLITFVTAVITALVALATAVKVGDPDSTGTKPWIDMTTVAGISIFALGSLLLVGTVTFLRIVRRNCVTDEYKAASDYVRRYYKRLFASGFQDYDPFPGMPDGKPKLGGLAHLVAVINGIVLGAFVFMLKANPTEMDLEWTSTGRASLVAFALALFAVLIQIAWAQRKRHDYGKAIRAKYKEIGPF